jgi:ubiquinone/menaquinone biosynthesis C-methylase UbiE
MPRVRTISIATCLGLFLLSAIGADVSARQLGSRPPDDWILRMERPERVASLQVDEIVARLALKPGQVVADIGAGPGIFSLSLSRTVGDRGKVYAEEVDPAFIDRIRQKLDAQHVTNVTPVLGAFTDPKLPAKDVDLAFFHDVLHHVKDRPEFLATLAPYVKRTGRICIIEYDAKTGPHKDDPSLVITREQLDGWMAAIGFTPIQPIEGLFHDARWAVIYGRR